MDSFILYLCQYYFTMSIKLGVINWKIIWMSIKIWFFYEVLTSEISKKNLRNELSKKKLMKPLPENKLLWFDWQLKTIFYYNSSCFKLYTLESPSIWISTKCFFRTDWLNLSPVWENNSFCKRLAFQIFLWTVL